MCLTEQCCGRLKMYYNNRLKLDLDIAITHEHNLLDERYVVDGTKWLLTFVSLLVRIIASFSRYTVYLDFIKYLISNVLWLFLAPVSTTSKFSKYSCLGKGRYGRQQNRLCCSQATKSCFSRSSQNYISHVGKFAFFLQKHTALHLFFLLLTWVTT